MASLIPISKCKQPNDYNVIVLTFLFQSPPFTNVAINQRTQYNTNVNRVE